MFGLKKDKVNFLLDGLSNDKKDELLSVQNWMNSLIDNEGFKVPPKETVHRDNAVLDTIEKAFQGKKWLGNYSQADGPWGLSKVRGPAMIIKEFDRERSDNYKYKLECKIAVIFDLGSVHHFQQSDNYLKAQGLNDWQIENRYVNFNLDTPFYLFHFHFSKIKQVYKFLDEEHLDNFNSLRTQFDHFIETSDKLTELSLKIDQYSEFPTEIFDTYVNYSSENAVAYRDYGDEAISFFKSHYNNNNNLESEEGSYDDYDDEEEYHYEDYGDEQEEGYYISYREIVSDLRSDFETLKKSYESWNDKVLSILNSESLTLDGCKNVRLDEKIYIRPRDTVLKNNSKIFYYTDPNTFINSIYETDNRFEKNIYSYAETPKLYGDHIAENVEFHLWVYNPIASDYEMDFEKNLEYYKKYFEKEGYTDNDILKKSIKKILDIFEENRALEEEWKSKSFVNKYINKSELDKFKTLNKTEEIIQAIAKNRKKHEDFLWYNRYDPQRLTIAQKYYLQRKISRDLHLSDPNYSNILNEKEKLIWTNLKKLYEEKYKFD